MEKRHDPYNAAPIIARTRSASARASPRPRPFVGTASCRTTWTVAGQTISPQFVGGAPGIVAGVIQVNVQIPTGLTPGPIPVVLQVGGSSSPSGVTIYVQ